MVRGRCGINRSGIGSEIGSNVDTKVRLSGAELNGRNRIARAATARPKHVKVKDTKTTMLSRMYLIS